MNKENKYKNVQKKLKRLENEYRRYRIDIN